MFLLEYIEPIYFFISLFIGLLLVYSIQPQPEILIKYPTPDNAGKIIYKDNADVCYIYESEEVKCPLDKSKIKRVDLQYINNEEKNNKGLMEMIF